MSLMTHRHGGDENSQDSDRANGMDKYVHLCLRDEHPMEYSAKAKGRIEKSIFIPISSDVLAIDGVRFVPGMSNQKGLSTYLLEDALRDGHLESLDIDALYEWIDWGNTPMCMTVGYAPRNSRSSCLIS
jgi:hypothetical protein